MKITSVRATPLNVPLTYERGAIRRETSLSACYVEVETDQGLIGHGLTAITEEEVIAYLINEVAGPALIGMDPMATEAIWNKLYWLLCPRGQTGYGMHGVAALDVALWDLKGKQLGQPVWRLLGAARSRVPVYTTFGFGFLELDALVEAARQCVGEGFKHLKMVVGHGALQRRDEPRPLQDVIREDAQRIRAVREAVGADADIYIDANCSLDAYHAKRLVDMTRDCNLAFFEEPITQNDVHALRDLRQSTGMALAVVLAAFISGAMRRSLGQMVDVVSACSTMPSLSASATCWARVPWTSCSPMSSSAAATPSAPRSRAWPRPSIPRSPTAAPSRCTTCICTRAWPTAGVSSGTSLPWK